MNTRNVEKRPNVFLRTIKVLPGNSSGFIPLSESHQKVLDNPSNDTVERTNSTKAVPLRGKSSDLSNPEHGILIEILPDTTGIKTFHGVYSEIPGVASLVISVQVGNLSCIDLIGSAVNGNFIQSKLDEYFDQISFEEYDHFRIDAGEPAYGSELTEDFNPLEAGLLPYISFNKGCYIGQEVVARLNTYDKVQRKLVKFEWDSENPELSGKAIEDEDRVVGVMTSSLHGLGMGFIRKAKAEEGNTMTCDGVKITVVDILAS